LSVTPELSLGGRASEGVDMPKWKCVTDGVKVDGAVYKAGKVYDFCKDPPREHFRPVKKDSKKKDKKESVNDGS